MTYDADKALSAIQRIVDEQTEDAGLWFCWEHITEAYLQQELRRLHEEIERWTKRKTHDLRR